ncbi:MAG: TrkH family potassium uptake protein [Myxococcales bacterium]|nr:TrkH family potassium uptake protein [Myxococcales bacterium]
MGRRSQNLKSVAQPVGAVVLGLGVTIALCGLAGWIFDILDPLSSEGSANGVLDLAKAAGSAIVVGGVLFVYGGKHASDTVSRREAVLAVALIWVASSIFGAIPFVVGADMSWADALFESVSGLTTTGATVITNIEEDIHRPLLLWRSLIQWLGGMGIVVLFVAVFPNIRAGGKHMFGEEVPGTTSEGLRPRIAETSRILWRFYAMFTGIEFVVLLLLGMPMFDALCHALTTMSTGGFSTKDASIGAFDDPWIDIVIALFMLLASINYALFYTGFRVRSLRAFGRSLEFKVFVGISFVATGILTAGLYGVSLHGDSLFEAFRYALFMVATTVSSTGYGTDDYSQYPPLMLCIVLLLMFVGGCAGSTAGGIKVERIILMAKMTFTEIRRTYRPNLVQVVRMGGKRVPQSAINDALVFFIIYMAMMGLGVMLVCWWETTPPPTAFGAVLSCLSNMGPAPFHIGSDNFADYGNAAKILFALLMLFGRLEFFALLAVFAPGFWRQ